MYVLPKNLTINNVESIQKELIDYLDYGELEAYKNEEKEATFDFLHLQDLDMAGLQLLLSAAMSLHKNGCSLRVVNVQAPIRELLQLTGAGDILTPE